MAATVLVAAVAAALAPVPLALAARTADRHLDLDGALVTALDLLDSRDPFCRLVVTRVAAWVSGLELRRAVPVRLPASALLLPALITLAFALCARTPPDVVGSQQRAQVPLDPSVAGLSRDLREAVATMLSTQSPITEEIVDIGRRALEIDSALRGGRLDPEQARIALLELTGSGAEATRTTEQNRLSPSGRDEAAEGESGAVDTGLAVLRAVARNGASPLLLTKTASTGGRDVVHDESNRLGSVSGAGGDGDGAGLGRAAFRFREPGAREAEPDRQDGARTWSLPEPFRRTEAGYATAGEEGSLADARGVVTGRETTGAWGRLLTTPERVVVEAYFDRLRLLRRAEEPGTGGPNNQKEKRS
jgi:hypothetical protein